MKNLKMVLIICVCVAAIVGVSVLGTLAWLTDTDAVTNTMTVGKVSIIVDEADVTSAGVLIPGASRVKGNEYHLIPGKTYVKDPTMTVAGDSEAAYVRMLLTLNCKTALDAIFDPGVVLDSIFLGYDAASWIYKGETVDTVADTITYEFRYKEIVVPNGTDVELVALFDSFTVPGDLDGADLEAIKDLEITVVGHAIQAEGFQTEDAAWAMFDQ